MEGIYALGVSLCTFAGAFVLLHPRAGLARAGSAKQAAYKAVMVLANAVASTGVCKRLLKIGLVARLSRELRRRLQERGFHAADEQVLALASLLLPVLGALGFVLARSPIGAVVAIAAACTAAVLADAALTRRRTAKLAREMPGIFRMLAVAMGAGQTLSQAIDYVASHEKGEAAREFNHAALRLHCGDGAEDVIEELGARLDAPGSGLLATALIVSHRTGSPLRALFQRSAQLVERASESERLLAVKTAQVRLSVRVVCLLPAVLVGLLSLISADFRDGLATPVGAASLAFAAALDVAAALIIRSLVKGVLK